MMKFSNIMRRNLFVFLFVLDAFSVNNICVDASRGINGAVVSFNEAQVGNCSPCERGRIRFALQRAWDLSLRPINQQSDAYADDTFILTGNGFEGEYESCDRSMSEEEEAKWDFPTPDHICDRLATGTCEEAAANERHTRRRLNNCPVCCRWGACGGPTGCLTAHGDQCRRRLNNGNGNGNECKKGNGVAEKTCPGACTQKGEYKRIPGLELKLKENLLDTLDTVDIGCIGNYTTAIECVIVDHVVGNPFVSEIVSVNP